ncbi:MAG: hypothetical protein Q9188_006751, partial [Gyalolechia gomerana]
MTVEARALVSSDSASRERDLTGAFAEAFSSHAPPMPWNDHVCYNALFPDVHLTFSFGEPLTKTRVHILLEEAKHRIQMLIDDGFVRLPLSRYLLWWDERRSLVIYAQKYKQPVFGKKYPFTCHQVLMAVDLLGYCGSAQEHFEEMWANVFAEGKQVGYIWMARTDVISGLLN